MVLHVTGLTKAFGRTQALAGVDLQLQRGQVLGFLGPNGAGKSTTIRILLGLLRADGGQARVLGLDPWKQAVHLHPRIAYVPGDVNLWPNLTGGEAIDVLAGLRGPVDQARRDDLVERFELDTAKKCGAYSKGNRQKVALVAALASQADLLILDEPTSGLDPLKEAVFQECVLEARDDGRTVMLSSHILAEVESLCDHVTIIRKGRTVQSGSLSELRHLTRTTITAQVRGSVEELRAHPGVHDLEVDEGAVTFDVDGDDLPDVVRLMGPLHVSALTSHPPTLDELFLRHYGDELDPTVDGRPSPS